MCDENDHIYSVYICRVLVFSIVDTSLYVLVCLGCLLRGCQYDLLVLLGCLAEPERHCCCHVGTTQAWLFRLLANVRGRHHPSHHLPVCFEKNGWRVGAHFPHGCIYFSRPLPACFFFSPWTDVYNKPMGLCCCTRRSGCFRRNFFCHPRAPEQRRPTRGLGGIYYLGTLVAGLLASSLHESDSPITCT